jgi:hypothetical protein
MGGYGNGKNADSTDGTTVKANPVVPTWMICFQLQSPAPVLKRPFLQTPASGAGEGWTWTALRHLPRQTGGTVTWSNVTMTSPNVCYIFGIAKSLSAPTG